MFRFDLRIGWLSSCALFWARPPGHRCLGARTGWLWRPLSSVPSWPCLLLGLFPFCYQGHPRWLNSWKNAPVFLSFSSKHYKTSALSPPLPGHIFVFLIFYPCHWGTQVSLRRCLRILDYISGEKPNQNFWEAVLLNFWEKFPPLRDFRYLFPLKM